MATIDISRKHTLDKEEAKKRAEQLAKSLEEKIGIRWRWEGDRITFDAQSGMAKGASGAVHVDPSAIRVEVDLPFMLRPMKGMVEGKINDKLDALINKA